MDTDRLETFCAVARRGSIASAARIAGCDPSKISRNISTLEEELGVRLFQRTTRRLELTEAGAAYLRRIEPIVDELAAARDEALHLVGRPFGRLRVTASSAYGQTVVAPLLPSFRERFPDVELELLLTDALVDLVAERIDVAIRLGPRPVGDWIVSRLAPTVLRLVTSPEYARTAGTLRVPQDIRRHACLVSTAQGRANWSFRRHGSEETVSVSGVVATSNTLVLRRCALDGIGIAALADWLVGDDIVAGRLVAALPDWEVALRDFDTGVWVVYPSRRFLPLKVRAFIDLLRGDARAPSSSVTG